MSRRSSTYQDGQHGESPSVANCLIYQAACIAVRYRGKTPTAKQLRDDYGMSEATSFRWRRALQLANGERK